MTVGLPNRFAPEHLKEPPHMPPRVTHRPFGTGLPGVARSQPSQDMPLRRTQAGKDRHTQD